MCYSCNPFAWLPIKLLKTIFGKYITASYHPLYDIPFLYNIPFDYVHNLVMKATARFCFGSAIFLICHF